MSAAPKNILIQGLPGIGKTTLIKNLAKKLLDMSVEVDGFYTEEKRDKNTRVGFDIVTLLDNQSSPLARKGRHDESNLKVSDYTVFISNFEKLALPILEKPKLVVIIDEIGKMELFSKNFQILVEKLISDEKVQIIATIPLKSNLLFVNKLKEHKNCKLFTVNQENRNSILKDIMDCTRNK